VRPDRPAERPGVHRLAGEHRDVCAAWATTEDEGRRDMSIRAVKVNGRKVWQARVAYQGLRKSAIRPTKGEARDAEAALLGELKAKAGEATAEAARPATLRALFEGYVATLEARGKGADTVSRAVETAHVTERLMPELLARPVSRITEADLYAFRKARLGDSPAAVRLVALAARLRARASTAKRARKRAALEQRAAAAEREAVERQREGAKASTINRDFRTFRAMLKLARPDFRFPGGVFLSEDETRVRWLRPEEELLAIEPMRSPFREIAKLAALTLMRLSEIRTLRREHVHLEQGVVMLPRAKAGARPVILSAEAQKILRKQLEAAGEWVFPSPSGGPYDRSYVGRVFRKAARAAGLRDFHFHDLRHHGATMALNKGFTAPIVMALGGWKTERMMRRYAAVTDATLRRAAEAVAGNEPAEASRWQRRVATDA
jgi:integrase